MGRRSAASRRRMRFSIAADNDHARRGRNGLPRELVGDEFRARGGGLERTAQVKLSGERLRQVVEAAGRGVLKPSKTTPSP